MRLLLDENVARPVSEIVRILLREHEVIHVHDVSWSGTKDVELFQRAAAEKFEVILTNDNKQLSRRHEVAALAHSGLHRIEYRQNNKHGGFVGLGAAIATVCAGLPHAMDLLAGATGQRLVSLISVDPTRGSRLIVTDPATNPPNNWPSPRSC